MTKKVFLALSCFALLVSFSNVARADLITIGFGNSKALVNVAQSGLSLGPAMTLTVSDTNTNNFFMLTGTASISTGAASSYSGGMPLFANYNPGGSVSVMAAACGGPCLTGNFNNGAFAASTNSRGSFNGEFNVTYVSPYITGLFGDPNTWIPSSGNDAFTGGNMQIKSAIAATETLGGGSITFSTVPEPGTLALVGTGFIGLAGLIRRRMS